MDKNKKRITFDIALIAMSTCIIFLQEQLLSILPNIQLTFLLIFVYSRVFKTRKTIIIILLHVLLDNLYNGSLSLLYTPAMLISYLLIPICLNTVFKNVNKSIYLSLLGILFSFIYCWAFIIPSLLLTEVSFIAYMTSDILFELILAGSSFLTILWLFDPLSKALNKLNNKNI